MPTCRTIPDKDHLPYALYRAAQVRKFDRLAIEKYDVPGRELMERAGQAAFSCLQRHWPDAQRILIVSGTGNNGGDGYVIARLAEEAGLVVDLVQVGDLSQLHDVALAVCQDWGGKEIALPEALAQSPDVIVDAMLGIGLERDVEDVWADAVRAINDTGRPIFAIDIPSGLCSDRGVERGVAIRAQRTISFIGLKQGMFTAQGPDCCGEIVFDGLQVPARVFASSILSAKRLDYRKVKCLLTPRLRTAHKGDFGHVLVVGGGPGFAGAARMAAEAALRAGAGLVSVAAHPDSVNIIASGRLELMVHAVKSAQELKILLGKTTVVVCGPGLGQSSWARDLFAVVLDSHLPLVIDADGLNLLAGEPVQRHNCILTPHPGEASRLLQVNTNHVQADRFQAAYDLQAKYSGVVVLKGAGTVVCTPDQRISVCSDGNPGMASGGMGDVLSGVIGALLAQGLMFDEAACAGVAVHARAGDLAAQAGERGLLAMDLMPHLRKLVNPV